MTSFSKILEENVWRNNNLFNFNTLIYIKIYLKEELVPNYLLFEVCHMRYSPIYHLIEE